MKGVGLGVTAVLALVVHHVAAQSYGVDVSSPVSQSSWECLRKQGTTFASVRAFRSNGQVDANGPVTGVLRADDHTPLLHLAVAPRTVKNARAANITNVHIYMFPCFSCGNPRDQVQATLDAMEAARAKFDMFWLDVEGPGQYWSANATANAGFIAGLIDKLHELGVNSGMYTSKSQWIPIVDSWTGASQLPLWYAHYDKTPTFADFVPFGGWSRPTMKQYQGTTPLCGASVDLNVLPQE